MSTKFQSKILITYGKISSILESLTENQAQKVRRSILGDLAKYHVLVGIVNHGLGRNGDVFIGSHPRPDDVKKLSHQYLIGEENLSEFLIEMLQENADYLIPSPLKKFDDVNTAVTSALLKVLRYLTPDNIRRLKKAIDMHIARIG